MSLAYFASLLRLRPVDAEPALYSERVAKLVLSRRGFVGASAALAASTQFSFAQAEPLSSLHLLDGHGHILQRWLPGERVFHFFVTGSQLIRYADEPYGLVVLKRIGISMPLYRFALHPQSAFQWQARDAAAAFVA